MSATDTPRRPRGRQFFANPGPTNIPDSVLRAVAHPTVDFQDDAFMEVYEACFEGLKRVLKTRGQLFMYTGSGHAAWEASLVNLFSPGDVVLIPETGHFSDTWGKMARDLGLAVIEPGTLPDGTEATTPVVPVAVGEDYQAALLWKALFEAGVYTNVAIHPAVPPGGALLRTSLMATHEREHLDRALAIIAKTVADFPDLPRA